MPFPTPQPPGDVADEETETEQQGHDGGIAGLVDPRRVVRLGVEEVECDRRRDHGRDCR